MLASVKRQAASFFGRQQRTRLLRRVSKDRLAQCAEAESLFRHNAVLLGWWNEGWLNSWIRCPLLHSGPCNRNLGSDWTG
jgi:hypothetical protein